MTEQTPQQTERVLTEHGTVDIEIETETCDSCGNTFLKDELQRMVVGDQRVFRPATVGDGIEVRFEDGSWAASWVCESCRTHPDVYPIPATTSLVSDAQRETQLYHKVAEPLYAAFLAVVGVMLIFYAAGLVTLVPFLTMTGLAVIGIAHVYQSFDTVPVQSHD